jgi:hypothetical protein
MQKYPVSRESQKQLNLHDLSAKIETVFGGQVKEDGNMLIASFGALKELKVTTDGKALMVETLMEPKVSPESQMDTIRRYNQFLELATGFTSKERAKRLQKEAKKGL